jgi:hypothetical protein
MAAAADFHARLSSFLTSSFADHNNTTDDDQLLVLEHYCTDQNVFDDDMSTTSGGQQQSGGGGAKKGSSLSSSDQPTTVDSLRELVSTQRVASEQFRHQLLGPLLRQTTAAGTQPSLAARTRCHRLKRVLDVHLDTMNVEQEVCKIWTRQGVTGDSSKEFVRRRAMSAIDRETQAMVELSQSVVDDSKLVTTGHGQAMKTSANGSQKLLESTVDKGKHCERIIYNLHESVEKILHALGDLATTVDAGGQLDEMRLMMEFDAIGRRRSSTTSAARGDVPALMNIGAIQTLLASLPPKYNAEIVLAAAADTRRPE